MQIRLTTWVPGDFQQVYEAFDRDLFEYLLPPGAKVLQFDGSLPGHQVRLQFGFPFFAVWESLITEEVQSVDYRSFVDIGTKLPFGLVAWRHVHMVRSEKLGTKIEDMITFSTGHRWKDWLYRPALYLAFLPRKWQYKRYFQKKIKEVWNSAFEN